MHRKKLLEDLNSYSLSAHFTNEEIPFLEKFLDFIKREEKCFERSTCGHVTASVWIVSSDKQSALLTLHKKFNAWFQLGGHADGDWDCSRVALKEAQEESGIENFSFITSGIFDIDIHPIPSACAYHYDVRYLLLAPYNTSYKVSHESLDLAWVNSDKIFEYSESRSVNRMNEKFKKYFI